MRATYSILSLSLLLSFTWCGEKPTSAPTTTSTNTKARHLPDGDVRGWDTYNAVVLVATKNGMGIDTVIQLVKDYDTLIGGGETYDLEARLPNMVSLAEEDHHPIAVDRAFFIIQSKKYGVPPAAIATVLMEFYTLGGSNREFPEPSGNR